MSTRSTNPLTWWELLRLGLAGGEYAEKRVPELIASAIASHQDENALVGIISDWLRRNLIDENHTALIFGVARVIRSRGGRFFVAAAETLETLPAVAHELRQTSEMQNGTNDERRARLSAAIADHFTNTFQAAKDRLAHIPIALGGNTMSDPSTPQPTGGVLRSLGSSLSNLFSGAGHIAGRIAEVALVISGYVMAGIGLCVAYLVVCVAIAWNYPENMDAFAWKSFYVLVGAPVIVMILGVIFGRVGRVIQLGSFGTLAFFSSALILIAFAVATVTGIVVNNDAWGTVVMLMVVATVWDRVVWGLTQKFLGTPGFFLQFLPRFLDDFRIDAADATALANYWRDSNAIEKITIPVAGAINAGALIVTVLKLWQQPLPFLLAVGLLGLELAVSAIYIRMNIRLSGENDYPAWLGMKDVIKAWMKRLYDSSMTSTVAIPIVIVVILAFAGIVGGSKAHSWWTKGREASVSIVERTAGVVSDGTSKGLDAVERHVGSGTKATSGSKPAGTVEANQPKTMTKAQKAAAIKKYCDDNPIDQTSTCKK